MYKNSRRVVLVSNRLPMTVEFNKGQFNFKPSSGGLATAIGAMYKEQDALWVGWPGSVPDFAQEGLETLLRSEFNCSPVFLSDGLSKRYYDGFANDTIWPIFHSFPTYAKYSLDSWNAYVEANTLFCRRVISEARGSDIIWIHDYHLMLLPKLLRENVPDATIGFFLHIPFPQYETLRVLPWHKEIVESLLSADLVGFHTYDYAQAFLGATRRLFGYDNSVGQIIAGNRAVQADVFPIGIDFKKFSGAVEQPLVKENISLIRESAKSSKVIFALSRLDYTKGILQTVSAFEKFLDKYSNWRGKVVLNLVLIPSREGVPEYQQLKRDIDQAVGRVNGKYGKLEWTPILYAYRSLAFEELVAAYAAADVALIIPLRDGMNLIAKEYLATKNDSKGSLVLSELAGASKELLESIIVNPNSEEEVVDAIHKALIIPEEDQVTRNATMRKRLENNDVRHWAGRFIDRIAEVKQFSDSLAVRILGPITRKQILEEYTQAGKRLLVLDYDGTLVRFADSPSQAVPTARVFSLIQKLAANEKNKVVILSGREKTTLEIWFGVTGATLVAEHGALVRERHSIQWVPTQNIVDGWKEKIKPILQLFVERIPASFIEEKDFSLAWHYRKSDAQTAADAAKELIDTLTHLTANLDIGVSIGSKVVEVKSSGISKGSFYSNHLAKQKWDFVLAVGDDWSDESLFSVLPGTAYSVRVGLKGSLAKHNLETPSDVVNLLYELVSIDEAAEQ